MRVAVGQRQRRDGARWAATDASPWRRAVSTGRAGPRREVAAPTGCMRQQQQRRRQGDAGSESKSGRVRVRGGSGIGSNGSIGIGSWHVLSSCMVDANVCGGVGQAWGVRGTRLGGSAARMGGCLPALPTLVHMLDPTQCSPANSGLSSLIRNREGLGNDGEGGDGGGAGDGEGGPGGLGDGGFGDGGDGGAEQSGSETSETRDARPAGSASSSSSRTKETVSKVRTHTAASGQG